MSPQRLIYLLRIGDALQFRLSFTRGNALLKFAQVGYRIGPNRKNNDGNKQEYEGYGCSHARV